MGENRDRETEQDSQSGLTPQKNEVENTTKNKGSDSNATTDSNNRRSSRGRGRGRGRGRTRGRGRGQGSGRSQTNGHESHISRENSTIDTRRRGRGGRGRGRGRGGPPSITSRHSSITTENRTNTSAQQSRIESAVTSQGEKSDEVTAPNSATTKPRPPSSQSKRSEVERVTVASDKSRNSTAIQKSPAVQSTARQVSPSVKSNKRPETTQSVISSIGSVSLPKTPMSVVSHQVKNESDKQTSTGQNKSSGMSLFTIGRLKNLFSKRKKSTEQAKPSNEKSAPTGKDTRNTLRESNITSRKGESVTRNENGNDVHIKSSQNQDQDNKKSRNKSRMSVTSAKSAVSKQTENEIQEPKTVEEKRGTGWGILKAIGLSTTTPTRTEPDNENEERKTTVKGTNDPAEDATSSKQNEQKLVSNANPVPSGNDTLSNKHPTAESTDPISSTKSPNQKMSPGQDTSPEPEASSRPVVIINTNFTQSKELQRGLGGVLTGQISTQELSKIAKPKTSSDETGVPGNINPNHTQPPMGQFAMPMPQYSYVQMPMTQHTMQSMMHPMAMPYGLPSYNMYNYHSMNQMIHNPYGYNYNTQIPPPMMQYPPNMYQAPNVETGAESDPLPDRRYVRSPLSSKSDILKSFKQKESERHGHYLISDSIGQELQEPKNKPSQIKSYRNEIPIASFGSTIPSNFKIQDSLYSNLPTARITEIMETGQRSDQKEMSREGKRKRKTNKEEETDETIEEILKREHEEILKMEKIRQDLAERKRVEETLTSDMSDILTLIEKGKTVSKETTSLVKAAFDKTGDLDHDDDDDDIEAVLAEFKNMVKKQTNSNPRVDAEIRKKVEDEGEFSDLLRFIETGKEYLSSDDESMDDPERLLQNMEKEETAEIQREQVENNDTEEGAVIPLADMTEKKRVEIADLPFMSNTHAEIYDGTNRELRKMLNELGEELEQSKIGDADAVSVKTPDSLERRLETDDRVKMFASPDISLIISQDTRLAMEERQKARDRVRLIQERDHAIADLLLKLNQEADDAGIHMKEREKRIGDRIIEGTKERAGNMLVIAEDALSAAKEVLPDS